VAQCFVDPQATVANPAPQAQPATCNRFAGFQPATMRRTARSPRLRLLSCRCAACAGRQTVRNGSSGRFEHGGDTHRFKLYIPDGYHGQRLPLIVMLHGAQQDPDDFAAGTEMNAVAESEGFIVVYPEQSEGANPLRCWNWFRPADQMRDSGETAAIAALTREVMHDLQRRRCSRLRPRGGRPAARCGQSRRHASGPLCCRRDSFGRALRRRRRAAFALCAMTPAWARCVCRRRRPMAPRRASCR